MANQQYDFDLSVSISQVLDADSQQKVEKQITKNKKKLEEPVKIKVNVTEAEKKIKRLTEELEALQSAKVSNKSRLSGLSLENDLEEVSRILDEDKSIDGQIKRAETEMSNIRRDLNAYKKELKAERNGSRKLSDEEKTIDRILEASKKPKPKKATSDTGDAAKVKEETKANDELAASVDKVTKAKEESSKATSKVDTVDATKKQVKANEELADSYEKVEKAKKSVEKSDLLKNVEILEDRSEIADAKTAKQKRDAAAEMVKDQYALLKEMQEIYDSGGKPSKNGNLYDVSLDDIFAQQSRMEVYIALYEKYSGSIEKLGKRIKQFSDDNGFTGSYQYNINEYEAQVKAAEEVVTANEKVAASQEKVQAENEKTKESYKSLGDIINESATKVLGDLDSTGFGLSDDIAETEEALRKVEDKIAEIKDEAIAAGKEFSTIQDTIKSYTGSNLAKKSDFQEAIKSQWKIGNKAAAAKLFEQYQLKFPDGKFNPEKVFGAEWVDNFSANLEQANRDLAYFNTQLINAAEAYGKYVALQRLDGERDANRSFISRKELLEEHLDNLKRIKQEEDHLASKSANLTSEAEKRYAADNLATAQENLNQAIDEYNSKQEKANALKQESRRLQDLDDYEQEPWFNENEAPITHIMEISKAYDEATQEVDDFKVSLKEAVKVYRELGGDMKLPFDEDLLKEIDIPVKTDKLTELKNIAESINDPIELFKVLEQRKNITNDLAASNKISEEEYEIQRAINEELEKRLSMLQIASNLVYHAGDLSNPDKTLKSFRLGNVSPYKEDKFFNGTTGLYTTENVDNFWGNEWHYAPISTIDLSYYKMFDAKNEELATKVKAFFEDLNATIYGYMEYFDYDKMDSVKITNVKSIESLYQEFKEVFEGINLDFETFAKFIADSKAVIKNNKGFISEELPAIDEGIAKSAQGTSLQGVLDKVFNSDSFQTQLLKMLGFEGIDLRGTKYNGTYSGGTVVFDVKPESIKATNAKFTDVMGQYGYPIDEDDLTREEKRRQLAFDTAKAYSKIEESSETQTESNKQNSKSLEDFMSLFNELSAKSGDKNAFGQRYAYLVEGISGENPVMDISAAYDELIQKEKEYQQRLEEERRINRERAKQVSDFVDLSMSTILPNGPQSADEMEIYEGLLNKISLEGLSASEAMEQLKASLDKLNGSSTETEKSVDNFDELRVKADALGEEFKNSQQYKDFFAAIESGSIKAEDAVNELNKAFEKFNVESSFSELTDGVADETVKLSSQLSAKELTKAFNSVDLGSFFKDLNIDSDVVPKLIDMYTELLQLTRALDNGADVEDKLNNKFVEIIDTLMKFGSVTEEAHNEYKDFYEYMKGVKLSYTDADRSEFGDNWASIKRRFSNQLVTASSGKGISADSIWAELCDKFPYLFSPDTINEKDQLREIITALGKARDANKNGGKISSAIPESYRDILESTVGKQWTTMLSSAAKESTDALEGEADSAKNISREMDNAAQAKEKFVNANKKVGNSAENSADSLNDEADSLEETKKRAEAAAAATENLANAQKKIGSVNGAALLKGTSIDDFKDYAEQIAADQGMTLGQVSVITGSDDNVAKASVQLLNKELAQTMTYTYTIMDNADGIAEAFLTSTKYSGNIDKALKQSSETQKKADKERLKNQTWLIQQNKKLDTRTRSYKNSKKNIDGSLELMSVDSSLPDNVDKTIDNLAEHIRKRIQDAMSNGTLTDALKTEILNDLRILENEIAVRQNEKYSATNMKASSVDAAKKGYEYVLSTLESRAKKANVFGDMEQDLKDLRDELDKVSDSNGLNGFIDNLRTVQKKLTSVMAEQSKNTAETKKSESAYKSLITLQNRLYTAKKQLAKADSDSAKKEEAQRKVDELQAQYDKQMQLAESAEYYTKVKEREAALDKELSGLADELLRKEDSKYGTKIGAVEVDDISNVEKLKMSMMQLASSVTDGNFELKGFNSTGTEMYGVMRSGADSIDEVTVALKTGTNELVAYRGASKTVTNEWDNLKASISSGIARIAGMYLGFNDIVRYVRQGIESVRDLDSAMTELKKVTDETDATYAKFLKTASQTSKTIGATLQDFTTVTSDFARLGYSIQESADLAKTALVYENVGDGFSSVSEASESIISTMKAFKVEATDTMGIVDKFNEVNYLPPCMVTYM